jgi:hypothetical protein
MMNVGISVGSDVSGAPQDDAERVRTGEDLLVGQTLARISGGVGAHEQTQDVPGARVRDLLSLRSFETVVV